MVNVSPYKQIAITRLHITVSSPAYFYGRIYNSEGTQLKQTTYVMNGLSVDDTISPSVLITDFEREFSVKIMNYGNVISAFLFRPEDYFLNSVPFPSSFSKNDAFGRTVNVYVSWN
ncbi:MAG: hypothetical protein ACT4ON_09935 [Bacteroidota bacterium]